MNYKKITGVLVLAWLLSPVFAVGAEFNAGDKFSENLRSGGTGPEVVVIPGGLFTLGGGSARQQGLGVVKIEYPLAFGATEVTVGQYRQFLTASRSGNLDKLPTGDDNLPMSGVSWDEAEAYITWLSREAGHAYRLPSASEWEYAARARSTSLYHWGDKVGENNANCLNCKSAFVDSLSPVGSFKPNSWGLYDMHGNVWEWTKDCIDSNAAPPPNGMPKLFGNCNSRELRGGSAQSDAWSIRSGARGFSMRSQQNSDVGFRVVRDIAE